ncbi:MULTISPECIES: DnaJ domain-containing protein [Hyphobacterium]|uniref:DnaJ domain-containing protein n=1 Tax=Hyphobacterium vulgare TaxID=1736751 RepID=A0ABV6ZTS7_9PROT
MPFLLAGLLLLVLAYFGLKAFARMRPNEAKKWSRAVLGAGAIAVGGVMTLRGLAVLGIPVIGFGMGLIGVAFGLRPKPGGNRGEPGGNAPTSSGAMTRREALEILGLEDGAGEEDIRAAYRAQMKRNHPDMGGSPALARRIQEARDILLRS